MAHSHVDEAFAIQSISELNQLCYKIHQNKPILSIKVFDSLVPKWFIYGHEFIGKFGLFWLILYNHLKFVSLFLRHSVYMK